jgi:hypothetical protein
MNGFFGTDCYALSALLAFALDDKGFTTLKNNSVMRTGF